MPRLETISASDLLTSMGVTAAERDIVVNIASDTAKCVVENFGDNPRSFVLMKAVTALLAKAVTETEQEHL